MSRQSTPVPELDIVSRQAFHWHSELAIYVKGEKQDIPANIGIGAVHQPVHTHNDSDKGIIHLEFQGLARKQDVALGQFFQKLGEGYVVVRHKCENDGERERKYRV